MLPLRNLRVVGVMESSRFKILVTMSSDHAGVARELQLFESTLRKILARIEDPRQVRDFLRDLAIASREWCLKNNVDVRGWMERYAGRRG